MNRPLRDALLFLEAVVFTILVPGTVTVSKNKQIVARAKNVKSANKKRAKAFKQSRATR